MRACACVCEPRSDRLEWEVSSDVLQNLLYELKRFMSVVLLLKARSVVDKMYVAVYEVRWKSSYDVVINVWVLAGGDQEVTGDVQVSRRVGVLQSHHVLAAASPIQRDRWVPTARHCLPTLFNGFRFNFMLGNLTKMCQMNLICISVCPVSPVLYLKLM
jgi:hypothetical protein